MGLDRLRRGRLAVVGLDTTSGTPPLITELAVVYVDDGVIAAGPLVFWVDPDAPSGTDVRPQSRAQTRLAPRWPEVAERILPVVSGPVLVTHDQDRLDILRQHFPDWEPAGVAHTRDLAEQVWPGMADYSLDPAILRAGLDGFPRVGPGAAVEAQAVALLLAALLRQATAPASSPNGLADRDPS
jgi:DNA polymerase III epsilon subunit-like protein